MNRTHSLTLEPVPFEIADQTFWVSPAQFEQVQQALITGLSLPTSLETVAMRTTPQEMQGLQPQWSQLHEKCQMISLLCRSFQPILGNRTYQVADEIMRYGTLACTTYQNLNQVLQDWQAQQITDQAAQTKVNEIVYPLIVMVTELTQDAIAVKQAMSNFDFSMNQHQRDVKPILAHYLKKSAQAPSKIYPLVNSLVTDSLSQILISLKQSLPVLEQLEGAWSAIASDLNYLILINNQDIRQFSLLLTDLGIETAIKAWQSVIQIARQSTPSVG